MTETQPHAATSPSASPLRAWLALVWFSLRRQARARTMVWIALGLLALSVVLVFVWTEGNSWTERNGRTPPGNRVRNQDVAVVVLPAVLGGVSGSPEGLAGSQFVGRGAWAALQEPRVMVFVESVVFLLFLSFLMPLWSLSFATESVGGERESGSLVWLLTRPLPRPAVYLAKFVALLPWCVGLNLAGFALICLAAGEPGLVALRLCWAAVLWGSLAFAALFLLVGAVTRRAAVVAIVYSFFLETIMGNMPGYLKRVSVNFYVRCMVLGNLKTYITKECGGEFQVALDQDVYLPVDALSAWLVLMAVTAGLLAAGMIVFQRSEYVTVE
jgi:ABC-type transport system involved in multi-copper enzyme maturation permease subunit